MNKFLKHFSFSKKYPLEKNFVNFLFWFFVILGIYLLISGSESLFLDLRHQARFMGVFAFLSALFLTIPLIVYNNTRLSHLYNKHFIYLIELLIGLSFLLDWLGNFALYRLINGYDSFAHFSVSLFLGNIIFLSIFAFKGKRFRKRKFWIFLAIVVIIGLTGGLFWEGFEKLSDILFKTTIYGDIYFPDPYDTLKDIIYNLLGIVVSFIFSFYYFEKKIEEWRYGFIRSKIRRFKDLFKFRW